MREDAIMWWTIPVVVIAFDTAIILFFVTVKRRGLQRLRTTRGGSFGPVADAGAAGWAAGADFSGCGEGGHGAHSGCGGGHSGCGGGGCGGGGCGGGCG